jgi:hypothetical protein
MIALLLILLAGFAAFFGVSASGPGGDPSPPITVVGPVTTADGPTTSTDAPGTLLAIDARRTGGVGYQDLHVVIDDPGALQALAALVPATLPPSPGPPTGCADCWVYHVVLQFAGEPGSIVLDYDQANEPPELSAFFDALDPYLQAAPNTAGPADTRLEDVPPQGSMERIDVERHGGLAAQDLQTTIDDPQAVADLAALAPYPLPSVADTPLTCADCWSYRIVVHYRGVGEPAVLEFSEADQPAALAPFVAALNDRLEGTAPLTTE